MIKMTFQQEVIEAALRAHVGDLVNVPENHRIDIAFRATRGTGGYTAEISIVHVDTPLSTAPVAAQTAAMASGNATEVVRRKPGPKPGSTRKAKNAQAAVLETSDGDVGGDTGTAAAQDREHVAENQAADTEVVAQKPTPALFAKTPADEPVEATAAVTEVRGSLFGNLQRPQN